MADLIPWTQILLAATFAAIATIELVTGYAMGKYSHVFTPDKAPFMYWSEVGITYLVAVLCAIWGMKQFIGEYRESKNREMFAVGTVVKVTSIDHLDEFKVSWPDHQPMVAEQMEFAGHVARVTSVEYCGDRDVLYTLDGVPGVWPEQCLVAAWASSDV